MNQDEIKQISVEDYECPVCMNYASPPILMCTSSHIICYSCWQKCPTCPTCRIPKTPSRSFNLEARYPLLTFPCKYDDCTFKGNDGLTPQHERNCNYMPIKCPFDGNFQCHWFGPYKDAEAHLTQNHPQNIYFGSSVELVNEGFKKSVENRFVVVLFAFGSIFQLKWEYNLQRPLVEFNIRNIGYRQDDPNNYSFKITFTNYKKRGLNAVTRMGNIPSLFGEGRGEFNMLLSQLLLYGYSKKRRTLTYSVTIERRRPGQPHIINI